nr:MAG TPA: hypothetical protein [Caudoviricetes sp.]
MRSLSVCLYYSLYCAIYQLGILHNILRNIL